MVGYEDITDGLFMFIGSEILIPAMDAGAQTVTSRPLDVTILKTHGKFWSVGPRPMEIERWFKMYLHDYQGMKRVLAGRSLAFMAHAVYIHDGKGEWICMKNRFLTPPPMPFSSLEEARLKCAVMRWPDPVLLYEG